MNSKERILLIRQKREDEKSLNLKYRADFIQILLIISGLLVSFSVAVFSSPNNNYAANNSGITINDPYTLLASLFFSFLFFTILYYTVSFAYSLEILSFIMGFISSLSFSALILVFLILNLNATYSLLEFLALIWSLTLAFTLYLTPSSLYYKLDSKRKHWKWKFNYKVKNKYHVIDIFLILILIMIIFPTIILVLFKLSYFLNYLTFLLR